MTDVKRSNIEKIVLVLSQLDEKSLLLIDSGAKLLATRQAMDKDVQIDKQLQEV